ncbi:MAG TPA: hypothetical protein VM184_04430 [Gaiellaceae bacterium]|nr:hypothetical protein [Gaiellaceae bacterium]
MEAAAHITWRPLGRLLVERGLLSADELELALAKQQQTGQRLGETIVESGFVSGPELASALAAQYGIELTTEKGFGTGLRSEIQRRHESDRGRVVRLVPAHVEEAAPEQDLPSQEQEPEAETETETETEPETEPESGTGEAALLVLLEEQWAKLAAAEATLAERELEARQLEEVNERLRAQIAELRLPLPLPDIPSSHLVFVQLDGRYELVVRDGPPPRLGAPVALRDVDGDFVVAGSRRSPLPGDERPCVFAQRA